MLRKIIFKYTEGGAEKEMILPVTPQAYEVQVGQRIEKINIHELGDVNLSGYESLESFQVDVMLPARKYPFVSGTYSTNPFTLVETVKGWITAHQVVRYIVSDTPVNIPVLVESFTYGERDGSNDLYGRLSLAQYRPLNAVRVESGAAGNVKREASQAAPAKSDSYVIQSGDCLSAICRKFYGDASLAKKLADFNGIANPNLIYTGNTLKIPDKSQL